MKNSVWVWLTMVLQWVGDVGEERGWVCVFYALDIKIHDTGSYGTFLAASVNLPLQDNALREGYIGFNGRKLLQGLNPLMFVFALIANVIYVGSILVRTTE